METRIDIYEAAEANMYNWQFVRPEKSIVLQLALRWRTRYTDCVLVF
jgi:hypothetical protein